MSSKSPFDRGKQFGLYREQVVILFYVTAWFNSKTLTLNEQRVTIGSAYEPTVRQLCGDDWEPAFDQAHEDLISSGFLKSKERDEDLYIAGRRCRWLPTEKGMKVIDHIFKHEERLYPDWTLDEHTRVPTFRDGSELMEHRKGTMAASHLFGQLTRCSSTDVYPRIEVPQRPDLRLGGHGDLLAQVEVLTDHNNRSSWKNKFMHWTHPNTPPIIWIFPNRPMMVTFWNHLLTHTTLELDGGRFGGENKNNWSPRRVNDRLRRSSYGSTDACWTIGGLIEADSVDAFEFMKRNNIILQS